MLSSWAPGGPLSPCREISLLHPQKVGHELAPSTSARRLRICIFQALRSAESTVMAHVARSLLLHLRAALATAAQTSAPTLQRRKKAKINNLGFFPCYLIMLIFVSG